MTKVLVLYYSSYGHIETMAGAAAEGLREAGAEAHVKRVPELVPEEIARGAHFKLDQPAPVAIVAELPDYDAIMIGVPTRYGRMASQMSNFWDQAGSVWATGQLTGKVGSAFASTATQHGGQETTLFSAITNMMHFGMIIVGLPYSFGGQMTLDEITGGVPVRRDHHRRRQGRAPAERERTRRRPLPGRVGRADGGEAEGLKGDRRSPSRPSALRGGRRLPMAGLFSALPRALTRPWLPQPAAPAAARCRRP